MDGSLLIKFGQREHLLQLQKEGIVYCNSIKWFANYLDENIRGDEFEAVVKTKFLENTLLQLREVNNPDSTWKNLNSNNVLYKEYYKEPLGNLYCMSDFKFNFSLNEGDLFIEKEKFIKFGDSFLLVLHQPAFFDRLKKGLAEANLESCKGHVEYIDLKKHSGVKKIYQKDVSYSFQQEYRIHIHTNHSNAITFNIGNIEDISILYDLASFAGFRLKQEVVCKI